ncbi:hypothetical protein HanPSC8_Chr02g0047651 [Helianthus annuus]|nr:hypothetical protein HanPSC8_Chr02g0047651 [Helianthus annuus]
MPVIISSKLTDEEKSRLIEIWSYAPLVHRVSSTNERSSGERESGSEANFREDGREE